MPAATVECVPNFSEGKDPNVISALARCAGSTPGVTLLDHSGDASHNRSVLTLAGPPESILEAAVRLAGMAAARIDLTRHSGVHPRIGALDVLPFVPLAGTPMEVCIDLAHRAGQQIWDRHRIPSYFYESAALRPDRRNLAWIRHGQFEGLRTTALTDPERAPDTGGPGLHPTAGAVAIGARKFLIAFNVNLHSEDLDAAREIAGRIRESSGGLRCVKALGLRLNGLVQVSMNLTDFEVTPIRTAFDAVAQEAARLRIAIAESELIGLAPAAALDEAIARHVRLRGFHPQRILENRLAELK
ncbi:MAG: glutamate formimidoyltransferase [Acidobacteria bacterium]|nr:glutamate formimidoyltransferase [Acidobacteriota bacterium]